MTIVRRSVQVFAGGRLQLDLLAMIRPIGRTDRRTPIERSDHARTYCLSMTNTAIAPSTRPARTAPPPSIAMPS